MYTAAERFCSSLQFYESHDDMENARVIFGKAGRENGKNSYAVLVYRFAFCLVSSFGIKGLDFNDMFQSPNRSEFWKSRKASSRWLQLQTWSIYLGLLISLVLLKAFFHFGPY